MKVAIIGIGQSETGLTNDLSYKELMFDASVKAYEDAEISPKQIQSFISSSEDFLEGTSIFDEYVPDQLGGVQKPVCTISGSGLHGIISAYMQIKTGLIDFALVESHSKISDVLNINEILEFGFAPENRLGVNPHFLAALEMNRFLHEHKIKREKCAEIVVKNKKNALKNDIACYGANLKIEDVLKSEVVSYPLTKEDIAKPIDSSTIFILANSEKIKNKNRAIFIKGVGWINDNYSLEKRNFTNANYCRLAGQMAYKIAKIRPTDIDFAEIDDTYSYKELHHKIALELKDIPINISGGSLGIGYSFENSSLLRLAEVVYQLRGEAGKRQLKNADIGIAQSWRGIPTNSGAVVILSRK